jgi:hypothetical protein
MSSTASISAAKRRRGQHPTFTSQASTRGGQQPQPQGPVRVNPITIIQNHELRLREIENNSTSDAVSDRDSRIAADNMTVMRELETIKSQLGALGSTSEKRINELINENSKLKESLSALQANNDELFKLKDMMINIQSSFVDNAQMVATLKAEFDSSKSNSDTVVAQDNVDDTATMRETTIGEEEQQTGLNVTFMVKESDDETNV